MNCLWVIWCYNKHGLSFGWIQFYHELFPHYVFPLKLFVKEQILSKNYFLNVIHSIDVTLRRFQSILSSAVHLSFFDKDLWKNIDTQRRVLMFKLQNLRLCALDLLNMWVYRLAIRSLYYSFLIHEKWHKTLIIL